MTSLDEGLRCVEEGKGVGVGSTTQWVTMAGCSLDDRAGSGVIKMTMRAVVVVGLRSKSQKRGDFLASYLQIVILTAPFFFSSFPFC